MAIHHSIRLGSTDRKILGLAAQVRERNGGQLPAIADQEEAEKMAEILLRRQKTPIPGLHPHVTKILTRWMQQNAGITLRS